MKNHKAVAWTRSWGIVIVFLVGAQSPIAAELDAQPPSRATIHPSVITLDPGQSQRFRVIIRGNRLSGDYVTDKVTWAVNNIPGGDDLIGRINEEGVYTAPPKAPVPREIHICAQAPEAVNRRLWATVLMEVPGPPYRMIQAWGEAYSETVHFTDPHCIALDADGNLLIADYMGSRVTRFTPDGTFLGELGNGTGEDPGQVVKPRVVALDPHGRIFVSDQKSDQPRIQVFSHEGEFLKIFAPKGTRPGHILRAHGLVFDSQERLHVVDVDNMRVTVYDRDGQFVHSFGRDGTGIGEFNAPHGIAIDANDELFVVGYYGPCQKFTSQGKFLKAFAYPDPPDGPVYFHSIVSDQWGNVYLTVRGVGGYGGKLEDTEGKHVSIVKYNNNGDYVTSLTLSVEAHAENWATVDQDGNVYAIYVGRDRMGIEIFAPQ